MYSYTCRASCIHRLLKMQTSLVMSHRRQSTHSDNLSTQFESMGESEVSAGLENDGDSESKQCSSITELRRGVFVMGIIATCFKLLLMNSEHSTDMDVHLHWKALTHSLPLREWYTDESSQWTLDYPPLFAYFELILSYFAPFQHVLGARATFPAQKLYLRLTVLVTDPILYSGVYSLIHAMRRKSKKQRFGNVADLTSAALILFCPPLILVDNIHFQYNGLPLGILLHSLASFVSGNCTLGVVLFAISINLKHTLLPLAPVLAFITLCILLERSASITNIQFIRSFFSVLTAFLGAFFIPWLPLSLTGAVPAVLSRLFPFRRGLLHSYWAPNFWAPYATLDRVLSRLGYSVRDIDVDSTSGLIGASTPFATLPNVTPKHCMALSITAILPVLAFVHRKKNAPIAAVYAALSSFMFGWHVHEKNILVALVPFAATVATEFDGVILWAFSMLAIGGSFGVFPLIVGVRIAPFKIAHFVAYSLFVIVTMWRRIKIRSLKMILILYAIGTLGVEWYAGVGGGHRRLFDGKYEFLPLIIVSLYSSVGVIAALVGLFFGLASKAPSWLWYGTKNRTRAKKSCTNAN